MTVSRSDAARAWTLLQAEFDGGPGARGSLGLIALATDRAGVRDFEDFLGDVPGVGAFATRVPVSTRVTPDALRTLHDHLGESAALLVPGSQLDAIAFSCTSGAVAVGLDKVAEAVGAARPGIPVTTPVGAATVALKSLGTAACCPS